MVVSNLFDLKGILVARGNNQVTEFVDSQLGLIEQFASDLSPQN